MTDSGFGSDWKVKLRYGKISTLFQHFSVIAEGHVVDLSAGFASSTGRAFMGMKAWATDADEAMDMIRTIAPRVGFQVEGKIYVYETEAEEPPRETPHGYSLKFTRYDDAGGDEDDA